MPATDLADTQTDPSPPPPKPAPPRGLALLRAGLSSRKAACMLGFGFASGLPFALLVGTVTAWLGEEKISLATIGVFSWIGLAYSFKFLWAPLVDRVRLPGLERLGRRKGWIVLCQAVLVAALAGLALTDPKSIIDRFALIAFIGAVASATQDIAIDGWRIDVADERAPLELLSALVQFGYRTASIVGGAFTLFLAARLPWPQVFGLMAGVMAAMLVLSLFAPDTPRPESRLASEAAGGLGARARAGLLAVVLASWGWAVWSLVHFMALRFAPAAPGAKLPSVADFTKTTGLAIVAATVLLPLAVAGLAQGLSRRGAAASGEAAGAGTLRAVGDHLWSALIAPLQELAGRLGWGVLGLVGLILTYGLCYNIWASFAYPFYLDTLHYSKDEVAFASKIFGIFMTMLGISLGGVLFVRLGRFPTLVLGALLPPLGNLLYADLADGAPLLDGFAHATGLTTLAIGLGGSERMLRLLITIAYENVATGFALTVFVAYVSGQVSKRYAAVQYALLSSLTSLVGTLGRGITGEAFDHYGYGPVFRLTALTGLVSATFVLVEWLRARRAAKA